MSITSHTALFQREHSIALSGDQARLKAHGFTDLMQHTNTSYGALSEQSYSKKHFTTRCFDIVLFLCLLFFFFFKSCKAYHLARQKLQSAVSRSRHASSSIVKQVLKIIFPQQKNISELKHSHPHRLLPVAAWQESSWNILGKKSNKSNTNSLLAGFYLYKITVRYNEQINNKAYWFPL